MGRILADLRQHSASGIFMPSPLPIDISLWDFSLHYYAQPGVSHACIALQDGQGVNVNVLLWALWLAHRGHKLEEELLGQAIEVIGDWDRKYVVPLRQLRRQMKIEFGIANTAVEKVRAQIKQAELFAEKHLLKLLEDATPAIPPKVVADTRKLMQENLCLYLQPLGIDEVHSTPLITLLK